MGWGDVGGFLLEAGAGTLVQAIPIGKGAGAVLARAGFGGALVGGAAEMIRGDVSVEGFTRGAMVGGAGAVAGHLVGRGGGWGLRKGATQLGNRATKRTQNAQTRVTAAKKGVKDAKRNNRRSSSPTTRGDLKKAKDELAEAKKLRDQAVKAAGETKNTTDRLNKWGDHLDIRKGTPPKGGWGNHALVGLGNAAFRAGNRPGQGTDPRSGDGGGGEKKRPPTAKESLMWDGAAPARAEGLM